MEIGSTPDGDITWLGKLKTWTQKTYDVQLIYPMAFPFTPPRVFVISPKIARSRHIYEDGHLCLFHHDDKAWQPKTTAATMMSWVSLWLHCYEEWQETGNWPRPEADDFVITPNY
jgi:ubiquitin-protein ligase